MRIVDFSQRTPEWHRWRTGGITASEAAVVMSRSPYQTPWQLWAEKTGLILPEDLSANPNIQRGIRLEPLARKAYEKRCDDLILPLCAEADCDPLFRASFDGINSAGEPVEFKCPAQSTFEVVQREGEQSAPYQLYWVQVQHQLLVSAAKRGWLVFFSDDGDKQELIDFEIQRDDAFLEELQESARAFWLLIESHTEPDKDPDRDSFVPSGEVQFQWAALANEYCSTHQQATVLEAQLKSLKQTMKTTQGQMAVLMGRYAHADYAGVKLCRYGVSGSIDYRTLVVDQLAKPLEELDEAVVELYRKPHSERWRASVTKSKGDELPLMLSPRRPEQTIPVPGQHVSSLYF